MISLKILLRVLGILLIFPVCAHSFLIQDNYVGYKDNGYGDLIGATVFEIYSMDVTTSGGFMDVRINTNFKPGLPYTYGVGYGDLFISTNGWTPYGTQPYAQDFYGNGERWEFVFDTSAQSLFQLPDYNSTNAKNYISMASSGGGYIERDGQEVLYIGGGTPISDGSNVDLSDAGMGGSILYRIEMASLGTVSGGEIGLKWGPDCANDTIEGMAPVPEPTLSLLMGGACLVGFAVPRIKKRLKVSR